MRNISMKKRFIFVMSMVVLVLFAVLTAVSNRNYQKSLPEVSVCNPEYNLEIMKMFVPETAIMHDNKGDFVFLIQEKQGYFGKESYVKKIKVEIEDVIDGVVNVGYNTILLPTEFIVEDASVEFADNTTVKVMSFGV